MPHLVIKTNIHVKHVSEKILDIVFSNLLFHVHFYPAYFFRYLNWNSLCQRLFYCGDCFKTWEFNTEKRTFYYWKPPTLIFWYFPKLSCGTFSKFSTYRDLDWICILGKEFIEIEKTIWMEEIANNSENIHLYV